jgi:hypothetical protein
VHKKTNCRLESNKTNYLHPEGYFFFAEICTDADRRDVVEKPAENDNNNY